MPASRSRPAPPRSSSTVRTPPFELRPSPIQGLGAFATRRIRKGTRIAEYTGERITQEEADARYDDAAMERHHTFLFNLDEDTVVDGAHGGNDSRFINHSCEPNCQAFIEGERIFIYSLREIQPGEELLYDYGYERSEEMDEEDEELYVCRCGAPSCRGTILAPPEPAPSKPAAKRKSTSASKRVKRGERQPGSRGKASTRGKPGGRAGSKRTVTHSKKQGKQARRRTSSASLA